jgi:hypothetical protein
MVRSKSKHGILKIAKIASVCVLLSASAILFIGVVAYAQDKSKLKLDILKQFPIQDPQGRPTLSPPRVHQTNECATKV